MSLHWPSAKDIVLGGTVPPPFADLFNHLLPFQYRLTEKEQAYHAAIFGASGSRKSKLLQSIFLQHLSKGRGVGLIDPHADLALDILKCLIASGFFRNEEAFDQLIFLDFANGAFVPFNVLRQSYDPHTTALNALEGMIRVWPELGDCSPVSNPVSGLSDHLDCLQAADNAVFVSDPHRRAVSEYLLATGDGSSDSSDV
jgi:hypothetical protein